MRRTLKIFSKLHVLQRHQHISHARTGIQTQLNGLNQILLRCINQRKFRIPYINDSATKTTHSLHQKKLS